jgi:hypothetical protein
MERCRGSTCTNFAEVAAPSGTTHSDTGLTAATTYRYRVRAADAAGNLSAYSAIVSAATQAAAGLDFSLSNGGSRIVTQGQSITNGISAAIVSGTVQSVLFSAAGLPSGATATFSPTSCAPACSTTLTISTLASTPTGAYTITVTGVGGGITRITTFLLTVTSAGTGTVLGNLAASMQPGEWRELVTNNWQNGQITNTPGRPRTGTIFEYTDEAQWDPVNKKIYIIGTALPYGYANQKWIEYSESTNSWSERINAPFYIGFHSYDHAALDHSRGHYYVRVVESRAVHRYSFATGQWTRLPDMPLDIVTCCGALEYFPEIDRVVYVDNYDGEFLLFNPSTNTWSVQPWQIPRSGPVWEIANITEYDPVNGVLYFGGGWEAPATYELYKLDRSGQITKLAKSPVGLRSDGSVQTVDPVSGKFLAMNPNGSTYEYDPVNNSWRIAGRHPLGNPGDPQNFFAVAAKIPEYGVIMAASFSVGKVYLYKHSAGR